MIRYLAALVLFIGLSSVVSAVGVVQVQDMSVKVGVPVDVTFTLVGENASKEYEFYVLQLPDVTLNRVVKFDGVDTLKKNISLSGYEKKTVVVSVKANSNGIFLVGYGLRESGMSMFQSELSGKFKLTATGSNTTTTTTTSSSSGGSGGGGGGGGGGIALPLKKQEVIAPSAPGKIVQPEQIVPVPVQDTAAQVEASAGPQGVEGGAAKSAVVDAVESVATPIARSWGMIALGVGIVMIILQIFVVRMVWRGEAS